MNFYYFCYAVPLQAEAHTISTKREVSKHPADRHCRSSAAIPDPRILLHDVKAIG